MTRPIGGWTGNTTTPTRLRAAGAWSLRDHQLYKAAGLWPTTVPVTSNTIFRLDASVTSSITEASSLISNWADVSGNGNDFAQSTGASKPTKTGDSVVFPASAFYFVENSSVSLSSNALSFFAAVKRNGRNSSQNKYGRVFSAFKSGGLDYNNTDGILLADSIDLSKTMVYRNGSVVASSDAMPAGIATVVGFVLDGTSVTIYSGSSSSTGTTSSMALAANRIRIGNSANNTDSAFDGVVYEAVGYTAALSSGDATRVLDYLKARWGIS